MGNSGSGRVGGGGLASSDVEVRQGNAEDVSVLHDLVREAARAESSEQHLQVTEEGMRADFEAGAYHFVLALVDEQVAGMAIYYSLWDACRCTPYLYLDDLAVSARFRRRGVGACLVNAVCKAAATGGAGAVDFQVLRDNTPAMGLYRRLGAQFCDQFVNVSLCGEALCHVASAPFSFRNDSAAAAAGEPASEAAEASRWCRRQRRLALREAGKGDGGAVNALIRELAAYEGQADNFIEGEMPFGDAEGGGGYPWRPPQVRFLLAEAEEDDVPSGDGSGNSGAVGLAVYVPCYASWTGRRVVVLVLVVAEAARGAGVGSVLMQAVARRALDENISMLQWPALRSSKDAMAFYERKLGASVNATGEWLDASIAVEE